jgi:mannose-6-phosphate isomerase
MKRIEKPWGYENLIEKNDKYVMKELGMNKGHKCSIQYHEKKKETVYVLSGQLKVYIGKDINNLDEIIMNPNDSLTVEPFEIHRMEAMEDSVYLEASTPELDDVVRLQDEYGREGTSEA